MIVLGITGGIGSGKSTVASVFSDFNAVILNADQIGHDLLETEEVKKQLVQRWGTQILEDDKLSSPSRDSFPSQTFPLNRKKIAEIVFAPTDQGQQEREFLNRLLHPRICQFIQKQLAFYRRKKQPFVVLDAPLLLETGLDTLVDYQIFIDAREEIRWNRVSSRHWSHTDFLQREQSQISPEEKRKRADFILKNETSRHALIPQVAAILDQIQKNVSR